MTTSLQRGKYAWQTYVEARRNRREVAMNEGGVELTCNDGNYGARVRYSHGWWYSPWTWRLAIEASKSEYMGRMATIEDPNYRELMIGVGPFTWFMRRESSTGISKFKGTAFYDKAS